MGASNLAGMRQQDPVTYIRVTLPLGARRTRVSLVVAPAAAKCIQWQSIAHSPNMPQGLPSHKRMLRREGILVAKGRRSGRRWARDAGFARLHPLLLQCKKASTRTISGHEQAAAATITSFLRTISSFTQQEEREREREE